MKNPLKLTKWVNPSTDNKMIAHTLSDILVEIVESSKKEGVVNITAEGDEKMIEIFIHLER